MGLGGFVPAARALGYAAEGVDPNAPDEPGYHRTEFENLQLGGGPVDAVVACTSLHHVADLDGVLDRIVAALAPGGVVIAIEWAREHFDESTAQWCFARLPQADAPSAPSHDPAPGHDPAHTHDTAGGWLHRHHDRWLASGLAWEDYLTSWAEQEGMHSGEAVIAGLDARLQRRLCTVGPYFFADLDIPEADEQAAIDSRGIRPNGIRYVGQPR
jgi:SAM-dependent methyltransferase